MLPLVDKPSIQYDRGGGRGRHRGHPDRHRPGQAGHRGPLRPLRRAGAAAHRQGRRGQAGAGPPHLRHGPGPLHPPEGPAASATPSAWPSSTSATPFAVLLGDDVIDEGEKLLADLVTSFERHGWRGRGHGGRALQIKAYGCVAPADELEPGLFRMADIVEKPAPEEGTLEPGRDRALRAPPGDLRRPAGHRARGRQRDPDHRRPQAPRPRVRAGRAGLRFTGTRYDAGDKNDYLRATVELAARRDDIGPAFVAFLRRFVADLDRQAEARGPARH